MPQKNQNQSEPGSSTKAAEVVVLPNGFRILLLEDHSAPVVSMQTWVKFGGADEEAEFAGVAHVFEHMLFKGSKQFPNGDMAAMIEGAGGQVNAWTSNDETVYYATVSSRYWRQAFDALVDAVLNPLFDPSELTKEKEVIQEEIRRGKDEPDREMWYRLAALIYQKHPYGRPVIGFPETVDKTDRDALIRIHSQWYVPNNMVFVAVGDFDRQQLVQLLKERYGALPKANLPERPRTPENQQAQPRVDVFNFAAELARVQIGFAGVAANDADVAALDLLSDLLGVGYNSILYSELKRKRNLAHEVSAFSYTPIDPGMFVFEASCEAKNVQAIVQALFEQVRRTLTLEVDSANLAAAKSRMIAQFVHSQETYGGIARNLGRFDTTYGDPNFSQSYIRAIESVSLADLRRAAARLFDLQRANIAILLPNGQKLPSPEQVLAWAQVGYSAGEKATAAVAPIGSDVTAQVTWYDLPGGIRLIVQHDRTAAVVAVNTSLGAGIWLEPKDKTGIGRLMSSLWPQGTSMRTASQIERELDMIGGSISASAGADAYSLSSRFLREHLTAGLALYFDVFFNPIFPEQELEIERADQIREIEALRENKFRYTAMEFAKHFYGEHPYSRPTLGEVASVKKISRKDLQELHQKIIAESPLVISIVGAIEPNAALEAVIPLLPPDLLHRAVPRAYVFPAVKVATKLNERVLVDSGNQTHIFWGFPGVDRLHPDRAPLTVLDAILSNMGGRLFNELRDQKSLAYVVTAIDSYPTSTGYFAFYIACAPDKEAIAIQEFERVMREIKTVGVSSEELTRAQRYLLGSVDIQLQSTMARATAFSSSLLLRGRWDGHREYVEAISRVSLDDVKRVANAYLVPEKSTRVLLRASKK